MLCLSHGGYIDVEPKAELERLLERHERAVLARGSARGDADQRHDGPVDVAVVGGGVTGCACARVLAEAGLRVRLHEERQVAAERAAGTVGSHCAEALHRTT